MRVPRFPKAATSASGTTLRRLVATMVLCPGLILFACAGPSVVDQPTPPALHSNESNNERLVQYLANLQAAIERTKASQEKRLGGLQAMLKIEQNEQWRDRELLTRAEANAPPVMDVSLKNEWDETLTKLRHTVDDRLARSVKTEEEVKQLIAETEDLARQYGTLSEQVGAVNEQIKRSVPPSDAVWLERRDAIQADIRQLDGRQEEIVKRHNELSRQYRLRETDWERTRSNAIVTASINVLNKIAGRAKKFAVEQERQQALLREKTEEQQRLESEEQARLDKEAQRQEAKAGEQAAFSAFLRKYGATDLSDWNASYKLSVNPFSYQGKRVFLSGQYHKNISRHEAIVRILPDIVVWRTSRNLADGSPLVRCVVKVLGTTSVLQGMIEREVPHVQEIECLK